MACVMRNCEVRVLLVSIIMPIFVLFECKYNFINISKGILYEKRAFNVDGDVCHCVWFYEFL